MLGYLRIFSLNLVMKGESVNSCDINERDLLNRVRELKTDVRRRKDVVSIASLAHFIINVIHKENVYKELGEDDFLWWLMESMVETEAEGGVMHRAYVAEAVSFLVTTLYLDLRSVIKVAYYEHLEHVIKAIILTRGISDNIRRNVTLLICTIVFHCEEAIFNDEDIISFLVSQASGELQSLCVTVLVVLKNHEQIKHLILSSLDNIIKDLELCCYSPFFSTSLITLTGNIKILRILCRLQDVKKLLSQNFKLFFVIRLILKETRLMVYVTLVKVLMRHLYSEDQIIQIETAIITFDK